MGPIDIRLVSSIEACSANWVAVEEDWALSGDGQTMRRLLDHYDRAATPHAAGLHAARARLREGTIPLGGTILTRGLLPEQVIVHVVTRGSVDSRQRTRGLQLRDVFARLLDHAALHEQVALALHPLGVDLADATLEEAAVHLAAAVQAHAQAPTSLRRLEVFPPGGSGGAQFFDRLQRELGTWPPAPVARPPRLLQLRDQLERSSVQPTRSTTAEILFERVATLLSAVRQAIGELVLELRTRQPKARLAQEPETLVSQLPSDSPVGPTIRGLIDLEEAARHAKGRPDLVALRGLWRRAVELAGHPLFEEATSPGDLPGVRIFETLLEPSNAEPGSSATVLAATEPDDRPRIIALARCLMDHEHARRQLDLKSTSRDEWSLERLVRRLASESPIVVLDDLGTAELLALAQIPQSGSDDREMARAALLSRFCHNVPTSRQVEGIATYHRLLDSYKRKIQLCPDRSTLVGCMIDAGSTIERMIRGLLQFHCHARLDHGATRFVEEHQEEGEAGDLSRASLGTLLRWIERLDRVLRVSGEHLSTDKTGFSKPLAVGPGLHELAELRNRFGHDRNDLNVRGTRPEAEVFFGRASKWITHLEIGERPLFPRVVTVRGIAIDDFGRCRYQAIGDDENELHVFGTQRLELGNQYFVHPVVPPFDVPLLVYPIIVPVERW